MFFESGPGQGRRRLAAIFERAVADGRLNAPDPLRAADQFLGLCQATLYKRRLFNVSKVPRAEEVRADVEVAVATFIAAYGA